MTAPTPTGDGPRPDRDEAPRPDDGGGSVTGAIGGLQAGDPDALAALWARYFERLARMIRARLRSAPGPTATTDEEDVALSVLDALDRGVRAGRFPDLADRDDLWRVLAHLVKCKLRDRRRRLMARKNPDLHTLREADLIAGRAGSDADVGRDRPIEQVLSDGPSPALAAEMAEALRGRLDALTKPDARRIAELKLAGHTNEEIARELGCSLRKVTLRLEYIREVWRPRTADDRPDDP